VGERKTVTVEELPAHPQWVATGIDRIPCHRMANSQEVDPYLMCASSLQPSFHKRVVSQPLQDLEVSHGIPRSHSSNGHRLPTSRIAPYGRLDGSALDSERAMDQSDIAPIDGSATHHGREPPMHFDRFRHHEEAGRVLVQAVYHSRTELLSARGAVSHQGVDEGPRSVTPGRMHRHARGFVDQHQPLVFEEDGDRQYLRQNHGSLVFGHFDLDGLPLPERVALRSAHPVYSHGARPDESGDASAAAQLFVPA
jgi:hypothetical protein